MAVPSGPAQHEVDPHASRKSPSRSLLPHAAPTHNRASHHMPLGSRLHASTLSRAPHSRRGLDVLSSTACPQASSATAGCRVQHQPTRSKLTLVPHRPASRLYTSAWHATSSAAAPHAAHTHPALDDLSLARARLEGQEHRMQASRGFPRSCQPRHMLQPQACHKQAPPSQKTERLPSHEQQPSA